MYPYGPYLSPLNWNILYTLTVIKHLILKTILISFKQHYYHESHTSTNKIGGLGQKSGTLKGALNLKLLVQVRLPIEKLNKIK